MQGGTPSPISAPRTHRQFTRKTSRHPQAAAPPWDPWSVPQGRSGRDAMSGQRCIGRPRAQSEGRRLRSPGGPRGPGASGGEGLSGDGPDPELRELPAPSKAARDPGRRAARAASPSPVASTPRPLAREWWGSIAGHSPALGPSGCVLPGLALTEVPAAPEQRQAQSGCCRGVWAHLAWGPSGGWAGTLTTRAVRQTPRVGVSNHGDPWISTQACGGRESARGVPGLPRLFHGHRDSQGRGAVRPWGDGASESPGLESRGSGQRIQSVDRLPAEAGGRP